MKTIKLARVLKEGFKNFYRDKWLTLATVVIMFLSLYLMGVAIFLGFGVLHLISAVEDRVNISMYFDFSVDEERMLEIKKELEEKSFNEIESVKYISREDALSDFIAREGESEEIKEALDMIGDNPLPASLVIVAENTSNYETINTYLYQEYEDLIMDTNLEKNKGVINEVHSFIIFLRNGGIILGSLFAVIAILVTLNTIRMSLYAHRKEFEIMRLVGASNLYVKMPTLVEGVLYGFASGIIAVIFLVGTIFGVDPLAKRVIESIDISQLYGTDVITVSLVIIIVGVFLGFVSSYIGVQRYLEK